MKIIYKICKESLWPKSGSIDQFDGSPIDVQDGYLHFSTALQVRDTAARHFSGQTDLLLIAIDTELLGEDLRYESSRGGDLFPHLYARLPLSAVLWKKPLPLGPDGHHVFPDLSA